MAITHARFGNGTTVTWGSLTLTSTVQSISSQGGQTASELVTGLTTQANGKHKRIFSNLEELQPFTITAYMVGEFPPTGTDTITITYSGTSTATLVASGGFTSRSFGNSANDEVRMMEFEFTPDGDTWTQTAA